MAVVVEYVLGENETMGLIRGLSMTMYMGGDGGWWVFCVRYRVVCSHKSQIDWELGLPNEFGTLKCQGDVKTKI